MKIPFMCAGSTVFVRNGIEDMMMCDAFHDMEVALYYLWYSRDLGATADGRHAGEPFGTNFSPNLFTQVPGPLTDIQSFTKQHIERTINGGPLTLEFAAGIFLRKENCRKVAMLVKHFIDRGGHQLQLNAVNLDAMKDAQIHPEAHQHLVVCIWGWSAYFVELDKEFQNHVIARQEYASFLGYRKGEDGKPEIVESEAELIRRIYAQYLQGDSLKGIAKQLTEDGVLTPCGKPHWEPGMVRSILSNER